ncbi:MAG: YigZ family protein [Eubacteriales bacterium]|nr:YigZ family protein [Eubacteriales bacterium]
MIRHKAIYAPGSGEIVEKKSRFIAHVQSVETVEEAQNFIEEIKKKYWDARHNCSAFSVGVDQPLTRFSDDGEPGGTAGKPILEVILGSEVRNIVIVVTRYFGGTLLGTGGLVRAYTEASKQGLLNTTIVEKIPGIRLLISTDYTDLGKIQYLLAQNDVMIEDSIYTDQVTIKALADVELKDMICKKLVEATSGRVQIMEDDMVYFGEAAGEKLVFPE